MLIVNDIAYHQGNKVVGKVVGYGHKLVNNSYLPTLRVLVKEQTRHGDRHFVIEDLASKWMPMK
jgi:hypothetical protein